MCCVCRFYSNRQQPKQPRYAAADGEPELIFSCMQAVGTYASVAPVGDVRRGKGRLGLAIGAAVVAVAAATCLVFLSRNSSGDRPVSSSILHPHSYMSLYMRYMSVCMSAMASSMTFSQLKSRSNAWRDQNKHT